MPRAVHVSVYVDVHVNVDVVVNVDVDVDVIGLFSFGCGYSAQGKSVNSMSHAELHAGGRLGVRSRDQCVPATNSAWLLLSAAEPSGGPLAPG